MARWSRFPRTSSTSRRAWGPDVQHPGDPTPRSPREVLADRGYRMVASERDPPLGGPATNTLVVLHGGTETYWTTSYPVSGSCLAATWQRAAPVVETRITYRPVPG